MRPVLSVLIPTRNRPEQLKSLISLIERCPSDRVEFIISDNSDEQFFIETIPDNVRIIRPVESLNMTANWNFVASEATGSYVTFVGDDDAIIPSSMNRLIKFLDTTSVDLVLTPVAGYIWPSKDRSGNFFQEARFMKRLLPLEKSRKRLAFIDLSVEIPIPYNYSIFRRQLIDDFEKEFPGERFFSSRIPDVNSGAKLVYLAQSQEFFDSTVFVSGASETSNGNLLRTRPNHPNVKEFNSLDLNPPPKRGGWPATDAPPLGFITFFEAISEALIQLGIPATYNTWAIVTKSVMLSTYPDTQREHSKLMWPSYSTLISIAFFLSCLYRNPVIKSFRKAIGLFGLAFRVLTKRSRVVSVRGKALSSTFEMVRYLESSNLLNSKSSWNRVSVDSLPELEK